MLFVERYSFEQFNQQLIRDMPKIPSIVTESIWSVQASGILDFECHVQVKPNEASNLEWYCCFKTLNFYFREKERKGKGEKREEGEGS